MASDLLRVVLDTNVLLVSISARSRLHWVYAGFLAGQYALCVTTEVLAEYADLLTRHQGVKLSEETLDAIVSAFNLVEITPYYRFRLLHDPDDNKFVDCAIAANAHFIVSHDRDFRVLDTIDFPQVAVIDTDQFRRRLFP